MTNCKGGHRFFCAETIGIEPEGKVVVLALCTSCGEFISKEFQVSRPFSGLRLASDEEKTKIKQEKT